MGLWNRLVAKIGTDLNSNRRSGKRLERTRGGRTASAIAGLAGKTSVESLEGRQLLSYTITPADVDPFTGLGTRQFDFAVVLPWLAVSSTVTDQPATNLVDDLNDEDLGNIPNGPPGLQLLGSEIIVTSLADPVDPLPYLSIRTVTANNVTNQYMRVAPFPVSRGYAFTFPEAATGNLQAVTQFSLDLNAEQGLLTGMNPFNTEVQLRYNGEVIRTITGAELEASRVIAQGQPIPPRGTGTYRFVGTPSQPVFDEVQIVTINAAGNIPYRVDNLAAVIAPTTWAAWIDTHVMGIHLTLTGPVGASVTVFDLYGREIRDTIALGIPTGGTVPRVGGAATGIPDYNFGFGSMRVTGSDARTAVTVSGSEISSTTTAPTIFYRQEGTFYSVPVDSWAGQNDEMEALGFGYNRKAAIPQPVQGLPGGPGSFIIGSPFVRDISSIAAFNARGNAVPIPVTTGFTRADQGVFVEGSIGSLIIDGIVFGSSQIDGFVNKLNFSQLMGSLTVDGDAGSIILGGDAGRWSDDEGNQNNEIKTGGQIIVGRTLGELNIGGRNALDITVIGDINSPATRPPRDIETYLENEVLMGIDPATTDGVRVTQRANHDRSGEANFVDADFFFQEFRQKMFYGTTGIRNDQILHAEWIGNAGGSVRVKGILSGRDPVDGGEDTNDVYAFASDGTTPITIEGISNTLAFNMLIRIVDETGRTLAGNQYSPTDQIKSRLTFKPDKAGVYYINVTDPQGNDAGFTTLASGYTLLVSGMAPTTVGMFSTGGVNGGGAIFRNSFNVLSGSVGAIRIGTGISNGGGFLSIDEIVNYDDKPPTEIRDPEDDLYDVRGSSYSVAGNLSAFIAGSDIWDNSASQALAVELFVNGDLGELITGLNPLAGAIGPNEGDVNFLNMRIGGRVGNVNIRGGIGMDQDNKPDPRATVQFDPARNADVVIQTGVNGGSGDIGLFRTGFHLISGALSIRTSSNSTIGGLLLSQDVYNEAGGRTGLYNYGFFTGDRGVYLNTGVGSDIRFIDFPHVSFSSGEDAFTPIRAGTPVDVIDDNGTVLRISVENPDGVGDTGIIGQIRSLPTNGGQGSAIGQISVNLIGGRTLRIEGVSGTNNPQASLALGRVIVTASDANSAVIFSGSVPIDVLRLEIAGAMNTVSNETPGGDIVFVDANSLNAINIDFGNLGSAEVPAFGPQNWGVRLGLGFGVGTGGTIGGPITVPKELFFDSINESASIYRPLKDDNLYDEPSAYADDIGMPVHDKVRGLVVRTGSLNTVTISGNMFDVYVPGGSITNILGNSDGTTAVDPNSFQGISGVIYVGGDIGVIDPGDGIAPNGDSPVAQTGLVALDDIGQIIMNRLRGATLTSNILAMNTDGAIDIGDQLNGIVSVTITNGVVKDAFFGSDTIDSWWRAAVSRDGITHFGEIGNILLTNTDFFRSTISALNVGTITIDGGAFDASRILAGNDIGSVAASGYRNTTLLGDSNEVRYNEILAGHNINQILAGTAGGVGGGIGAPPSVDAATSDISDLTVEAGGSITGGVAARNITRSKFSVAVSLPSFVASGSIRASALNAGSVTNITAGKDIVSSEIGIAGNADLISAVDRIYNSAITISGPAGRLNAIQAGTLFDGSLTVTGTINRISSGGDIKLALTTSSTAGDINLIQAGRDADVRGDIGGNLQQLIAGRHFGSFANPGALVVRGDILGEVTTSTGVIYNEIRVGGAIRGAITSGGNVSTKPTANLTPTGSIVAAGTINSVTFNSDFGGDIISYSGGIASIVINSGSLVGGRTIAAYDGSIGNLVISNGHLLSNVYAEIDVSNLSVLSSGDGIFGSVGVDENRSAVASYDAFRNQLPQGYFATTQNQGVKIEAGRDVVNVTVAGSFYESSVVASQRILNVAIAGAVANDFITTGTGSTFIAGDSIDGVRVNGAVSNALFLAGATLLGKDNRAGGTGLSADTLKPGNITSVTIGGDATNVNFSAGLIAGSDGIYNTFDDKVINGLSSIRGITVAGTVTNSKIYGDIVDISLILDPRFQIGGIAFQNSNAAVDDGLGVPGVALGASSTFGTLTFNFTGDGQAFYNAGTQRVVLRNTTGNSQLIISSTTTIPALNIATNDDASLGLLRYANDTVTGGTVFIDGDLGALQTLTFGASLTVGGNIGAVTTGHFRAGLISAQAIGDISIIGDFGNANKNITGEVRIQALSAGVIRVEGGTRGLISIDRDATSFTSVGAVEKALLRFGGSIGAINAPSIRETFISARENIGPVAITGDVFDTAIMAGLDLGTDGTFGGTATAADYLSAGAIGTVTIAGNFRESDLTAGLNRGGDGFFGTSDDVVAAGRSSISSVAITGTQTGSTRNSESYRIAASGPVGAVTVNNLPFTNIGNFAVNSVALPPLAIQVTKVETSTAAQIYTTKLFFNQAMDASSFNGAIGVYEVRGSGDVEIRLINGVDFTLAYNSSENSVSIIFSRAVTERNLPQLTGQPGPGVFRFKINATQIRATEDRAKLDGNGNGLASIAENFSQDDFVGDAGDKINGQIVTTGATNHRIDFYPATDLNIVLDNNYIPDGLPDVNKPFTIRGSIGDHPDNDTNFFRFSGDIDVYRVTLKAGQVLRIGRMEGTARNADARLFEVNGNNLTALGRNSNSANAEGLPVKLAPRDDFETDQTYLIKTTGTYYILVAADQSLLNGASPNNVPNPDPVAGSTGDYRFEVGIFDDLDTGFTALVDSGDGNQIQNAPAPIAFAGPDQDFSTVEDNATSLVVGGYIFTLNVGPDGLPNTSDDLVSGSTVPNSGGSVTSLRDGNGVMTTTISSAIGEVGHRGLPSSVVTSDADVYHLNNRQTIQPGTRMKITVKMAESGADLGSRLLDRDNANSDFADYRGQVQFAFFDTSSSVGLSDANLVFSPSDLKSFVGPVNKVIASDGTTTYGYDSNGDFYIDFLVPERQGAASGTAGTFAVYLQGAFNSDYQLEIVTQPAVEALAPAKSQNFLIETQGGTVNWLESGGITTNLGAVRFGDLGILGGLPGGQQTGDYILAQTVAALNALYQNAGFDIQFSTNPADFEFQDFSTVYLTSSSDPLNNVLEQANLDIFGTRSFEDNLFGANTRSSLDSVQTYGYAQHVDALNADSRDEAVVFLPSFALLGYNSAQASVDLLVQSLTSSIGRKAAELMGAKGTTSNVIGAAVVDPLADNAVADVPGTGRLYSLNVGSRELSNQFDSNVRTDFYLGRENAVTLLDRYMLRS